MNDKVITITHTRADGTLIDGSVKGDGVYEVLRDLHSGWRYMRSIGRIGLQQSRDRAAKTWQIQQAQRALEAAGFTVEVHIDDATPGRSFAEAEAERYDRAEDRADRYRGYAQGAVERSDAAHTRYRQSADNWPIGERPGSASARAAHKRMMDAYDRSAAEAGKARHWDKRADTAEGYQAGRQDIPTTLRRIAQLEKKRRDVQRALDGTGKYRRWETVNGRDRLVSTPAIGEDRARLETEAAALDEELAYWRDHIAKAQQGGVKVWGPGDFAKGDYAEVFGLWLRVLRVNRKTLTLPAVLHAAGRVVIHDGDPSWTHAVPYHKITGHKTAEEIRELTSGGPGGDEEG